MAMNKELENKIDIVCEAINMLFAYNEPERIAQNLNFAMIVASEQSE